MIRNILVLVFVVVLTNSANIASHSSLSNYRLPQNLIPEYYRLELLTNLADLNDNFTFEGHVWMKLICKESTNRIILHSKNLTIDEDNVILKAHEGVEDYRDNDTTEKCTKIKRDADFKNCLEESDAKKSTIKIVRHRYDKDLEFYILETDTPLLKGRTYSLYIPYNGQLTQGLSGYYRSSYVDKETGKTKWLAVTQFESTDARMAFPCFDEPAFKARFQVNLGRINSRNSISNMPLVSSEPIKGMDGWTWDRYQVSVPMSTYLLAFMVSDFVHKNAPKSKKNDVQFRIWARKDAESQVDYASEVGPKVLEYYEDYFDEKFPLPKQDMVAIPDFGAGAMENWGLITYREVALLYDPNVTSVASQPYVAGVIAHELAHQWFGNLVTMKWWTDLWLNEGFATYVASLGVHHISPEWNSLDEEAADNVYSVFGLDSLRSSHPISVPIGHPREISQIFDKISYDKGSLVLRMMNLFLGEETFRDGVRLYLKQHKYKNAEQDDLWAAMTAVAHEKKTLPKYMTVKEIMDTWTLQTGYPVLRVKRDYTEGTATITQERYIADRDLARTEGECWWIPLSYTCPSENDFNRTVPKMWMKCDEEAVVKNLTENQWVIFNMQIAGVYRVLYDDKNWELLIAALNSNKFNQIHTLNRVQLIIDSTDFAKTGELEYHIPIRIMNYLERETEYLPWDAALAKLSVLSSYLKLTPINGVYRKYMKKIIAPIYHKIGNEEYDVTGENLQKIKLQRLINRRACTFNVGTCKSEALESFQEWMDKDHPDEDNPISKEMRSVTYCTAIKYGDEEQWTFLWQRYLNSNVGTEKSMILSSLGCTRELWLLNRYLAWSIDDKSKIRRQDSGSVFAAVAYNEIGYYMAKQFLFDNVDKIAKHHAPKKTYLGNYAKRITSQITTEKDLEEMQTFLKKNEEYFKDSQKSINQGLESATINIQWQKKHYHEIADILSKIVGDV